MNEETFWNSWWHIEELISGWWKYHSSHLVDPFKIDGQITNIYPDGIGVKVSNGEIVLTEIQIEGKKKMKALEYLNGLQDKNSIIGKIFE